MMYFEISVFINRPPLDVFAFLRDKDLYPQEPGSSVPVLDKTTAGATGMGTRYREVVQMLPFVRGEILSEITRFEPGRFLEEDFWGAGMRGHLAYEFAPKGNGTILIQRQSIQWSGLLGLMSPIIRLVLGYKLRERIESIKVILEGGWPVNSSI